MLCFAFIGQATAGMVMSYHMVSMHSNSHASDHSNMNEMASVTHEMPMTHHGDNHMAMQDSQDHMTNDNCCDTSCFCLTSACSTLAILIDSYIQSSQNTPTQGIESTSNLALNQQLSSLYRPPIFA